MKITLKKIKFEEILRIQTAADLFEVFDSNNVSNIIENFLYFFFIIEW